MFAARWNRPNCDDNFPPPTRVARRARLTPPGMADARRGFFMGDSMTEEHDQAHERQIDRAYLALLAAVTPTARRHCMDALERLIKGRSEAQIERMELERGLR